MSQSSPVYSVPDAGEEALDPFSQSSPFWLDRKPGDISLEMESEVLDEIKNRQFERDRTWRKACIPQRKRMSLVPGGFVWRQGAIGLDRFLLFCYRAKKKKKKDIKRVSLKVAVGFFRVLWMNLNLFSNGNSQFVECLMVTPEPWQSLIHYYRTKDGNTLNRSNPRFHWFWNILRNYKVP